MDSTRYTIMYDSADATKLPPSHAYAAYVNGEFANIVQVRRRFPLAAIRGIDVIGNAWEQANILDWEDGNPCFTTETLRDFCKNREEHLPHTTCIYTNRENLAEVEATLKNMWHVLWITTLDGTKLTGQRTKEGNLIVATQYAGGVNEPYDTSKILITWLTRPAPWT